MTVGIERCALATPVNANNVAESSCNQRSYLLKYLTKLEIELQMESLLIPPDHVGASLTDRDSLTLDKAIFLLMVVQPTR